MGSEHDLDSSSASRILGDARVLKAYLVPLLSWWIITSGPTADGFSCCLVFMTMCGLWRVSETRL